jgi:hypothetical protein
MSYSIHWCDRQFVRSAVIGLLAVLAGARVADSQALDEKSALAVRDALLGDMAMVHQKVVALAKAIPEDKYDWRPTPEVRTVGNVLLHMSMEWYFILPAAVGGKMTTQWPSFPEARTEIFAITGKQNILDQLERAWTYARAQLATVTAAQLVAARPESELRAAKVEIPPDFHFGALTAMMWQAGDSHEHLGQLITYARSVGVTPPWSR